jgi:hypothetical protein
MGSNTSTFCTCWSLWCHVTCVIVHCHAAGWHQLCYWSVPPGWRVSTSDSVCRVCLAVGALPQMTQESGGKVVIQLATDEMDLNPSQTTPSNVKKSAFQFFLRGSEGRYSSVYLSLLHPTWENNPLMVSFLTYFCVLTIMVFVREVRLWY